MSLKNKLNRIKTHIVNKELAIDNHQISPSLEIPFLDKWQDEGASPFFMDGQYCFIRKKSFPLQFQHGRYQLGEYLNAVESWNHSHLNHPLSTKGFQAEQLFFFDTETTGLGGGVGNTIFILGHAALNKQEIILTQHILPHPGAEIPLYYSFLSQVDYETLVTYNGKSFDWPQVKTRHTLIRDHVPKLPEFGHFDLFHSSRRMWKHRLERMKLAIVEKEVLGVNRTDDTPGFLAPMIYFDYVERKDPEGMFKMLHHNESDILSLITLYTHLSYQILGKDQNQTVKEKFEVGRWFNALGEISSAKEVYEEIENKNDVVSTHSQLHLGYVYKKQKNVDESLYYFQKVVTSKGNPDIQIEACIEVAKIWEHHFKDFNKAIHYCDIALDLINKGSSKKIGISEIEKRIKRNRGKLCKNNKE
ncbi:ribonuclease H-like domain-containing protein [Bacillus sp. CGMCC 1.16607]|uniref:ribonuclease H-like domain-containing protein n=1 Tax=Bacillus sp. CGMCC 1.16607 TaxID=3351842 RepID=UPI003639EA94